MSTSLPYERGGTYMVCPDCGKRGVSHRLASEDHYGCRYCLWSAFSDGHDREDVVRRRALRLLNPDHPAAPAEEGPPICYDCWTTHWPEQPHVKEN